LKPIESPKNNDIVAVYSTKYNGIYRARLNIQCYDDIDKVKCFLIDNGHTEMIQPKYIFSLPNHVLINKVS